MTYTAWWYRLPHGKEYEPMQAQCRDFCNQESAIAFVRNKAEKIGGIYWAGGRVVDETGTELYTITWEYDEWLQQKTA